MSKCIQEPINTQAPFSSTKPRHKAVTGQFGRVPLWLVRHPQVKTRAIQVYALLAAKHADRQTGTCYPSRQTLANALGVARSTIDVALAQLKSAGAITVQHRKTAAGDWTSNLYRLVTDEPPTRLPENRDTSLPINQSQNQNPGNQITSRESSAPSAPPPLAAEKSGGVPHPNRPHSRRLELATVGQLRKAIWDTLDRPDVPDNDVDLADAVRQLMKTRGSTSAEDSIRRQIEAVYAQCKRHLTPSGAARRRDQRPPANRWMPLYERQHQGYSCSTTV